MIDPAKAMSRVLAVAQTVSGRVLTKEEVASKLVVLTGDAPVLNGANGRWCFLDAFRLLLRVTGRLTLIIPASANDLANEVQLIAGAAPPFCNVSIVRGANEDLLRAASAILNVGTTGRSSLPWTCINSNGWIVRLASDGDHLPGDVSQENPIAAMMSASIGVAEVFKRLVGIAADVAPLLERFEFSLFDYKSDCGIAGPALPEELPIPNALLVGAGAIGNGIALLLGQLHLTGTLHVIDKQAYGEENIGTCVLVDTDGWVGADKAIRLAQWLSENSALRVSGERSLAKYAHAGADVQRLAPELILNGLDDVGARHDVQLAWPGLLFDGGISDVGLAVVQHRLDSRGLACLRCSFQESLIDHSALQRTWTGLSLSSLENVNRALTAEDVSNADPDKRAWLEERRRLRKDVCSVINEARLASLGVGVEQGFRPSVPFVATAAASLVVAEMVKALMFPLKTYPQTYTLGNIFLGVESAAVLDRAALQSCECVVHRAVIDRVRARRRDGSKPVALS